MDNSKRFTRREFIDNSAKAIIYTTALTGIGLIDNGCVEKKGSVKDSPEKPITLILEDDFKKFNSMRWEKYIKGHAYLTLIPEGIKLAVKDSANDKSYSNSEIYTPGHTYKYHCVQIRLKYENPQKGSMGWGFWIGTMDVRESQVAWFARAQGPINYPANGFWAVTRKMRKRKMIPIKGVSLEDWHTYTVDWRKDSVRFWIDDVLVAEHKTNLLKSRMRFAVWIDNAVYETKGNQISHIYQNIGGETALYLDKLKIMKLAEPYHPKMLIQ
jgi:hypothetical protein